MRIINNIRKNKIGHFIQKIKNKNLSCISCIDRSEIITLLGILLYRALLDIIYVVIIVPLFQYNGFRMEYGIGKYIVSWIVLFLFIPIIIKNNNDESRPSSLLVLILALVAFIPFTTMMGYGAFAIKYIICNIIYWFFLFTFHKAFSCVQFPKHKKFSNDINDFIVMTIGFVFLIVIIYISWRYTGFRFSFNLFNVYDLRNEANSFNLSKILEYLFAASKAVNPILLVYMLSKKKYFNAGFILVVQLLSFGINGSKTALFITILAVLAFVLYRDKYINKITWVLSGLSFIGLIEYIFLNTFYIVNFIIRRVMFLTNIINYYYFDFFTNNMPDYFRQSFLRYFGLKSPYTDIAHKIGKIYFNKPNMGANSGLISDAFANFGMLGIIIMPLLLTFAFKIFDECTIGLKKSIYIIPCIYAAFVFMSSFFFTVLLTHGFLAMCVVLYLLPRDDNELRFG